MFNRAVEAQYYTKPFELFVTKNGTFCFRNMGILTMKKGIHACTRTPFESY